MVLFSKQISLLRLCRLFDDLEPAHNAVYPHGIESYQILVRNDRITETMVWQFFVHSPLINVWAVTIVLFTGLRFGFRAFTPASRSPPRSLSHIFFDTFGLSFGVTGGARTHSRAERILQVTISLFALCASLYCSGLLVQHRTFRVDTPVYQTKADIRSNHLPMLYSATYWEHDVPIKYSLIQSRLNSNLHF